MQIPNPVSIEIENATAGTICSNLISHYFLQPPSLVV